MTTADLQVHPRKYTSALMRGAEEYGAALMFGTVKEVVVHEGAVQAVRALLASTVRFHET